MSSQEDLIFLNDFGGRFQNHDATLADEDILRVIRLAGYEVEASDLEVMPLDNHRGLLEGVLRQAKQQLLAEVSGCTLVRTKGDLALYRTTQSHRLSVT